MKTLFVQFLLMLTWNIFRIWNSCLNLVRTAACKIDRKILNCFQLNAFFEMKLQWMDYIHLVKTILSEI